MPTVDKLCNEILAGPVTAAYWWGEVRELVAEVRALSLHGVREEWSDVVCLGLACLRAYGWPVGSVPLLPGLGLRAYRKFEERLLVWEVIFDHHDASFHRSYLIGGGNYERTTKVEAALRLAGVRDIDWRFVSNLQARLASV